MKHLFTPLFFKIALLFSPLCLIGEDNEKIDLKTRKTHSHYFVGDNFNLALRKKTPKCRKKKKIIKPNPIFLLAQSFNVGVDLSVIPVTRVVNIQRIPSKVYGLQYPYTSERPTRSVTFEIPKGYKRKLDSSITIIFRTPPSSNTIKGSVKFAMAGSIKHPDGSLSKINFGKVVKKDVKTSIIIPPDSSEGILYTMKVKTSGKFSRGDLATLVLKRINSSQNNFKNPVDVLALRFDYNDN